MSYEYKDQDAFILQSDADSKATGMFWAGVTISFFCTSAFWWAIFYWVGSIVDL